MGLGPSTKMTTLHHYHCPVTKALSQETDIEFTGIIIDGVSENCDEKIYTAKRVGDLAQLMRADAAIVAIDGWGNHHIDFVNVIEQLGIREIPCVGLSWIAQQGRLVCTNRYVDCIIDFNKNASGYESCIVGHNNLTDYDAMKSVALVKNKLRKAGKTLDASPADPPKTLRRLTRNIFRVFDVRFGEATSFEQGVLTLRRDIAATQRARAQHIKQVSVGILAPKEVDVFVNSNLDFWPIATKVQGELGEGVTHLLSGVTVMLTGVEDKSKFQPGNIGSSEGILAKQVIFNRAGTPASSDYLIHIDILFEEGEGRTTQGIAAAHRIADCIVQEIRDILKSTQETPWHREEFYDRTRPGNRKIVLVKIVSGLGTMYDTHLFPDEPAGFLGSHSIMCSGNIPYAITPNQCRDGVIHSLL